MVAVLGPPFGVRLWAAAETPYNWISIFAWNNDRTTICFYRPRNWNSRIEKDGVGKDGYWKSWTDVKLSPTNREWRKDEL